MDTTRTHFPSPDDAPLDKSSGQGPPSPRRPDIRITFDCPACQGSITTEASTSSLEITCPHCGALTMTPAIGIGAGMVFDDFQLIRRIGRGAMGEVFLANQRSLSRMVAVKILAPGMTSSTEQVERFRREVQNLARLHHPNIVSAFYAGTHDDIHYLAMTYVDGENVHTLIQQQGSLPEDEALSVIYKVADALRYAWEDFGFIHRDIKPANIMIDSDGEVKLTDLGLSKFVYEEASATYGHRIFGTPHYMSPEQARGELDLDFRSDMYSLGITLYHMLAGHPPFDDEDINDILERQLHEAAPPIRRARPDVSLDCEAILQRLLSKNPNDRYDTWDAMLFAIADTLAAVQTSAQSGAYATQEVLLETTVRKKRRYRVLAGIALLMALVSGWAAWDYYRSAPEEPSLPAFAQQALDRARTSPELLNNAIDGLGEQMHRAASATEKTYLEWSKQRLERERKQRIAEVLDHLDERARAFLHNGLPEFAADVYTGYDGPWAEESLAARLERAEAYQQHHPSRESSIPSAEAADTEPES